MPTPFSHLAAAQQLLCDPQIDAPFRALLTAHQGAFLLGNIAADARVGAGVPREKTHFYSYERGITESPWRLMLQENPMLWESSPAQRAFVGGYVAHLAMDEVWSLQMVGPHFVRREWGDRQLRYLMLHIILIYMDERDLKLLESWQPDQLIQAQPQRWLAFIPDEDLRIWQQLIYDQIKVDGQSRTLEIFGERITKTPAELRAILDSAHEMQTCLWDHVSLKLLGEVESAMYAFARSSLVEYLTRSA
ncbi:MAG: hypothetical protein MUF87_00710 [Anaerolineae bacterium]|jgi:hypothetical protein|nr:hypothetical protein [Anaerolineae bacterium]